MPPKTGRPHRPRKQPTEPGLPAQPETVPAQEVVKVDRLYLPILSNLRREQVQDRPQGQLRPHLDLTGGQWIMCYPVPLIPHRAKNRSKLQEKPAQKQLKSQLKAKKL